MADSSNSLEYRCECGRRFLIPNAKPEEPRKCQRCGRMMYPYEEPNELFEPTARKKKKAIDDTLEYEYKFNENGQRIIVRPEPFSLLTIFRKIFAFFSVGK